MSAACSVSAVLSSWFLNGNKHMALRPLEGLNPAQRRADIRSTSARVQAATFDAFIDAEILEDVEIEKLLRT